VLRGNVFLDIAEKIFLCNIKYYINVTSGANGEGYLEHRQEVSWEERGKIYQEVFHQCCERVGSYVQFLFFEKMFGG